MQHTAYRRKLSAAATLRIQQEPRPTSAQPSASVCSVFADRNAALVARRAAHSLLGQSAQALHVQAFSAWKSHARGKRTLHRFRAELAQAHDGRLLGMILLSRRIQNV